MQNALEKSAADDDVVFFDFLSKTQEAKMGQVFAQNQPWEGARARSATADEYFTRNKVAFIWALF